MGRATPTAEQQLSELDKRLLNEFQAGLPLSERPFAIIAERLDSSEEAVIARLQHLQDNGLISRVGPVFSPNRVGASTLAAMAVPEGQLDEVAALVNAYDAVNHNYEREHRYNLWFVATAPDREQLSAVLDDIQRRTGIPVLDMPMIEDYFINLGFPLQWS